ncbi:MAG: hypothetical protein HN855_13330 [Anaerolineae bacterium]|nr:hypothetical protein [Anaerolineae bacterium]MBT7071464.1 hypothetical protein [Anaerolineae bacterium]MBT7326136.1 hypothetical protein [Anaerolineae bacterium]
MSSEVHLSSRESFILRFWRENNSQENWRGQIQHVSSGQITHIQKLDELIEYLNEYLEEMPSKATGIR